MSYVQIDFSQSKGKIKPMHAVNNGPIYKFASDQRITNLDAFKEAGIPYARTHDASFNSTYGGEHTVDVNFIFTDFDADPNDEASYDFACTDEYLKVIDAANIKAFYRLGSKIEHAVKKYNTLPPKDFQRWAVICEHIIKHYNYGWANGFHYGIEYWEIWNEPDLDPDDSAHKRCWGGTKKQFFEFYHVAATHLKKCFPELKIGGPALAHNVEWAADFIKQLNAPLDFFSWHIYTTMPKKITERSELIRKLLDDNGFKNTESILNEWNYVRGWRGNDWLYSLRKEKNIKGAAFIAGTMSTCQQTDVDMLMYYDARPGGMNGMFNTDIVSDILKGYYPFKMFNELYKLGTYVPPNVADEDIYVCSAKGEEGAAVMLTHYNENDDTPEKTFEINCTNIFKGHKKSVEVYILDNQDDMVLRRKEIFTGDDISLYLTLKLFTTVLLKINKLS